MLMQSLHMLRQHRFHGGGAAVLAEDKPLLTAHRLFRDKLIDGEVKRDRRGVYPGRVLKDAARVRETHTRPTRLYAGLRPYLTVRHVRSRGVLSREFDSGKPPFARIANRMGDQTEILFAIVADRPGKPLVFRKTVSAQQRLSKFVFEVEIGQC